MKGRDRIPRPQENANGSHAGQQRAVTLNRLATGGRSADCPGTALSTLYGGVATFEGPGIRTTALSCRRVQRLDRRCNPSTSLARGHRLACGCGLGRHLSSRNGRMFGTCGGKLGIRHGRILTQNMRGLPFGRPMPAGPAVRRGTPTRGRVVRNPEIVKPWRSVQGVGRRESGPHRGAGRGAPCRDRGSATAAWTGRRGSRAPPPAPRQTGRGTPGTGPGLPLSGSTGLQRAE